MCLFLLFFANLCLRESLNAIETTIKNQYPTKTLYSFENESTALSKQIKAKTKPKLNE